MRIGLARHFPVPHRLTEIVDADGFARWSLWYDEAVGVATSGGGSAAGAWDVCYSSDLPRARETAVRLHGDAHQCTPLLREVPFAPLVRGRLRLPVLAWQALARLGWWLGHASQPELRTGSTARASRLLDDILQTHPGHRVLIVAHGFFMHLLARELRRRGFRGRLPPRPRGGVIYLFEKG